ncbi:hypothetical protein [Phytohabitans rumicis]|uniref:Uncharacterized protein n=1 Tax=Phytohabitans rumicis TaxID=1076125 RepID=A0A6V8L941_9ACTN|nr:hypothetical protein [Phytohabitans rumicis]GFJ90537.1 hypothetical protein Prum_041790 [Phytohabitans rumicis]
MIAGLAGSVLVTAIRQRSEARSAPTPAVLAELQWPAPKPAAELTPGDPVPAQEPKREPDADLADDAYAPARAYVSDTATATEPAQEPARGQAAVAAPLWPEQSTPDTGRKRPRRGKQP